MSGWVVIDSTKPKPELPGLRKLIDDWGMTFSTSDTILKGQVWSIGEKRYL